MATREDWDEIRYARREDEDDDNEENHNENYDDYYNAIHNDNNYHDAYETAIDDLDRQYEHEQYYEAQQRAKELYGEYSDDEPDEEDLDALHAHADLQERARAAACDVAAQRYTWHGRWDEEDHEGHEQQADGWANKARHIWEDRDLRTLEEEHDRIDRQHAFGRGMLAGYQHDDQQDRENEENSLDSDDDTLGMDMFDRGS
ncbi:hypothetical protein LTR84_002965 [Exophiala bonariae]|uniref:CCD97-like C-terminal domain-containing protein n=1 Tax=Exophiala bonariae TaxID=1690606 RepID=A0AAV9N925_9EURO|nr:hypothetical protein LTR84_002965 [Exophiala bonariae]